MNELFYSSKGEIRNRILSHARDHWGLSHIDNLDPMVKLLLEALCVELFMVSNEVKDLELRVIEKLADTLAVETMTGALPAHAMLHAHPTERVDMVDETDSFLYLLRQGQGWDNDAESLELSFTPLFPVRIFDASIAAMASGNSLFRINDNGSKTLVATGAGPTPCPNTVFLGLRCPQELDHLQGMSFFFDWPYYNVDQTSLQLWALAEWSIHGQLLSINQGWAQTSSPSFDRRKPLKSPPDSLHYIDGYYRNRYFTIDTMVNLTDIPRTPLPSELGVFLGHEQAAQSLGPLCWIKLHLPAAIPQLALDELSVSINAFPVINRELHQVKYRLKGINDIIPIKMTQLEQFLAVQSLTDLRGNSYREIPLGGQDRSAEGLYALRYGGTERFDSRNAKEMLDYLFELLRDQRAAFANYGTDFLHTTLGELEKQLTLLSSRVQQTDNAHSSSVNYIVYQPLPDAEIMFLDYWTTYASLANGIKMGTALKAARASKTSAGSVYLLSTTVGGRDKLRPADRTRAYKYGLMTGNRIVTSMDLQNFCWLEFGEYICDVCLKPGIYDSKNPKQGFVRTIDILLTPKPDLQLEASAWTALLDIGLAKLQGLSVMTTHYRIMLQTVEEEA